MKRKILILASWYPSTASPVSGIFVQDQAMILSRHYEVVVLAPQLVSWRDMKPADRGIVSESIGQHRALTVYRPQVPALLPRPRVLAFLLYLPLVKKSLAKVLAEWGKPDLIHAHVVVPGGWAAAKLGQRHSIPVVLTEHSSPFAMQLRRGYQRHLVRQTLQRVQQVIAVSPSLAREIRDFLPGLSLAVVGNVIKTEFFVPEENIKTESSRAVTRFLSIALLSQQKGLSYLLHAAQILIKRGLTSFELIIGGDGPERPELERLALELGIAPRCRFLGLLTPAEVRHWMQRCEVFVMPSLHESFCIVLGEAMACGHPVIATRCGGPEYVVTPETGALVEAANPEALAAAMQDFITRGVTYDAKMVRRQVVERFGEEAFLRNLSAVYEQVWSKASCAVS